MHKQQGWLQAWEYCQAKLIQTLVRVSQGVDWSWSQCIKSHHAQTSSGKGLPSHFWTRDNVRSILPGLWRKRTGLLLSGPKSSFQMKVNFAFHLEQGPRVWRKSGEAQNPCCLKSSVKFPQSVMIWLPCHLLVLVHCVSEVHSQRSHLPGHFRALHCFMEMLISFSSRTGTYPHCQRYQSWFNDHGVTVLDWPANSPDLNPIENLWGIVKRKMSDTRPNNAGELKATVKEIWASIPPQQCHKLITSMPRRIEQ